MQKPLRVIVFGSGAREDAISEAVWNSPHLEKLFLASPGLIKRGEEIFYTDFEDLAEKCAEKKINLAIFGPEEPLCNGISDIFKNHGVFPIGVDKHFSRLESSKLFAKNFMEKHKIKTADYKIYSPDFDFTEVSFPIVIKADGLCKGKGVSIAQNKNEAQKIIESYPKKFPTGAATILLEEFLDGPEISLMSLWDGKTLLNFPPSRDFKKLSAEKNAPNTGGMGAFCPVNLTENQKKQLKSYESGLEAALKEEKADFCGFIYSGLIWAEKNGIQDWHVLEYNVRLGDPEAQAILNHLKSDFLEILALAKEKKLDQVKLNYKKGISGCLVLASEGYPESPRKGQEIFIPQNDEIKIYFAGAEKNDEKIICTGGRVLSLCKTAENPFPELKEFAQQIEMDKKCFRPDIDLD